MFVKDAVDAYDTVLKSRGNPGKNGINFGSGKEVSINEIAELIIKHGSQDNKLRPIHVEPRPVEVQRLIADISKAKKLLQFRPKIQFEKGLAVLIDWYKNYKSELWLY
jgi:UDP-glucose 4-epimerase